MTSGNARDDGGERTPRGHNDGSPGGRVRRWLARLLVFPGVRQEGKG